MSHKKIEPDERCEMVEVWRPHDLAQLELRRAIADKQPVPCHWHEEYQFSLTQLGTGELRYRGSNLFVLPASLFMIHPRAIQQERSRPLQVTLLSWPTQATTLFNW